MKIRIIATATNEVLKSFEVTEVEKAYRYALEMEKMGIEVSFDAPSINLTLGKSLGMTEDELEILKKVMVEEIDSHNL
ncbi:MAG: hypothetical protein ACPGJV_16105 [Bacteriovoracaceae bacterium]